MVAQATSVIVLLGLNCIKDCKYRTLKVGKRLAGPVLKILLNYPQVCFHFSSTKYHGSEVHPSHVKSSSTELSISPDLWAYSSGTLVMNRNVNLLASITCSSLHVQLMNRAFEGVS